jgi:hypothetical protein
MCYNGNAGGRCCQCAPGFYAGGCCSMTACTPCSEGTFSTTVGAASQSDCQKCFPGTFNPSKGQTSCQPCLPGQSNPDPGKSSCTPCLAGSFSSQPRSTGCSGCPGGFYCPAGCSSPLPCPPGSECKSNSPQPQPCSPGTYSAEPQSSGCSGCPGGFYCPAGCSSPLPCPPGSECKSNSPQPQPCSPGTYSADWGLPQCSNCPSRNFCPVSNMTAPVLCTAGYSCPVSNMSSPVRCEPGHYCPEGTETPLLCPSGTYNPSFAASACTSCPAGTYNPNNGSSLLADCIPCGAGTYNPSNGSASESDCVSCPSGSFCPSPGMSQFTPCVAGSYCPDARMSIPTVCPPGSYCPTNSTFAHPCPPGSFCPSVNMTEALPCPSGRYCPSSGASAGTLCNKGFWCPIGSSTSCRCRVLSYQDEFGASSCKDCEKQAVPSTAQVACITKIAQSDEERQLYSAVAIIFACVTFISFCLFAALLRSRHTFSSRPFHSGVCVYIACFVVYGLLKALAVGGLLREQSQQDRMNAEILLDCTFMIYFWLGFVGKMALIQLWMHLISRHSSDMSKMDDSVAAGQLVGNARRTWKLLRIAVIIVCVLYGAGFATLLVQYFEASSLCSSQISSAAVSQECITTSDDGPAGCIALVRLVNVIKYFEGIFSGVVAVAFTLYALTFNGLVYALLTNSRDLSKLQQAVVGNKMLRFLLSP